MVVGKGEGGRSAQLRVKILEVRERVMPVDKAVLLVIKFRSFLVEKQGADFCVLRKKFNFFLHFFKLYFLLLSPPPLR